MVILWIRVAMAVAMVSALVVDEDGATIYPWWVSVLLVLVIASGVLAGFQLVARSGQRKFEQILTEELGNDACALATSDRHVAEPPTQILPAVGYLSTGKHHLDD